MTPLGVAMLGAVAGFTILLGLPIGRLQTPAAATRTFLNAVAVGILVFLLWDVLSHAGDPVEEALIAAGAHTGSWARFSGRAAVFVAGLTVGLMGLAFTSGG